MSASRKILVTSALPNANGSIHLGHLLEHIQTDIWVRFQRLRGNQCIYVCADDTHGTATMLKAEQLGIPAERLIEQIRVEHERDFKRFFISHDNYYSTHSEENRLLCEGIYNRLSERGYIFTRDVEQLFDPQRKLFLADRFVKGECPNCGSDDQYGDNCEKCGATYDATDLKNPRSLISGATPVLARSQHYFFDLPQFATMLKAWTVSGTLQPEVANKLAEWLGSRPQTVGHQPRRAVFRFPDSGNHGQVLLRLDGRADRLHGEFSQLLRRAQRRRVRGLLEPRRADRGASLHRQGHRQLPRAVLAGRAARVGLSQTYSRSRARLHHRRRHEDVEVARDVHQLRHVPESSEPGISALLLRGEVERHGRRHRHHVRRFRAAREFRPRRQNRQHRKPLRRFHQPAERRRTVAVDPRPGVVARVRRCGTRDRGVVRIRRLRQSRPRNHRARRPGEPVHRAAGAVESRKRSRSRSRRAGGVHARHQSVQGADPVSRAGAARHRATQREVSEPRQPQLGRGDPFPGPPSHQHIRTAADPHRNGRCHEDDRRNPRNR